MSENVCKYRGCGLTPAKGGFCTRHAAEFEVDESQRGRTAAQLTSARPGGCSHEGCRAKVRARGLCANHYSQARRAERRAAGLLCSSGRCVKAALSEGFCATHYHKRKRPEPRAPAPLPPPPEPTPVIEAPPVKPATNAPALRDLPLGEGRALRFDLPADGVSVAECGRVYLHLLTLASDFDPAAHWPQAAPSRPVAPERTG